jgi:hypothetical protein
LATGTSAPPVCWLAPWAPAPGTPVLRARQLD